MLCTVCGTSLVPMLHVVGKGAAETQGELHRHNVTNMAEESPKEEQAELTSSTMLAEKPSKHARRARLKPTISCSPRPIQPHTQLDIALLPLFTFTLSVQLPRIQPPTQLDTLDPCAPPPRALLLTSQLAHLATTLRGRGGDATRSGSHCLPPCIHELVLWEVRDTFEGARSPPNPPTVGRPKHLHSTMSWRLK